MVARARRRAQGRTATSQPAERALRGRGPLMLDTVVAVPLWVLLAGSALCLLIAILIAVYLRHTLHQSARFAGERGAHDTHEAAQALQIQLKEALVRLKAARHKANEADRANRAKSAFLAMMRSEEHTSELQSLMRKSYAVFCLKKK